MTPLFLLSTDWHIKSSNTELSIQLMEQQISIAGKNGINLLICLGDVFDSRKAQPEIVLNTFSEILHMLEASDMTLLCIPGNHDKTDGYSMHSYLTPFEEYKCFHLIEEREAVSSNDFILGFLPYFPEDMWKEECEKLIEEMDALDPGRKRKRYLFSHQAVSGAINNNGSIVDSDINAKLLNNFEAAYFGHYHNFQQPLPNSYQLGAWKQSNFGEDDYKGFYLLKGEGGEIDFEMIPSIFPKYVTYNIDISEKDNLSRLKEIIDYKAKEAPNINIRTVIRGDSSLMKSESVLALEEAGIRVKKDIDVSRMDFEVKNYQKKEEMISAFKDFCQINEYPYEEGLQILQKTFEEEK